MCNVYCNGCCYDIRVTDSKVKYLYCTQHKNVLVIIERVDRNIDG